MPAVCRKHRMETMLGDHNYGIANVIHKNDNLIKKEHYPMAGNEFNVIIHS